MKKTALAFIAILTVCFAIVAAQEHAPSVITSTPQWEKVKSLVGEWEGYALDNGKKMTTRISVRMTGDGSAVMHWMDPGGPYEMITMFHMDKSELIATHYCAAHNQPRLRAVSPGTANEVAFDFKDGTNIRPGDSYMRQLVIDFIDADHHDETWGSDSKGKIETAKFYLTRVKKPAKG